MLFGDIFRTRIIIILEIITRLRNDLLNRILSFLGKENIKGIVPPSIVIPRIEHFR